MCCAADSSRQSGELRSARFNDRQELRKRLLAMILKNEARRKAQPR